MIDKIRVGTNLFGTSVCEKDGKLQFWTGSTFEDLSELQLLNLNIEYEKRLSEEPLKLLRVERNKRLAECDWMMTVDYLENLSPDEATAWKTYRQELRDLTETQEPMMDEYQNLINVEWPVKPE